MVTVGMLIVIGGGGNLCREMRGLQNVRVLPNRKKGAGRAGVFLNQCEPCER